MLTRPQLAPQHDVLLSNPAAWEDDVLHVYNDDYLGIRAAASAFPGRKLVLPNRTWHFREHLPAALELVRGTGCSRVVVHGMSNALYETARAVDRVLPHVQVLAIWHGGPSQWVDGTEAFELSRFLELDAEGVTQRSHIMKPGCNQVLRHPSGHVLVNCAPRQQRAAVERRPGTVLVPALPSLHKNFYGNLCAAELSGRVSRVLHYAPLPHHLVDFTKTERVHYGDPLRHLQTIADCAAVLNASTMDCHPMVDLEAASAGRPSLHMPLRLGVLDDHPLALLTTVEDPGSIASIGEALDRVLAVPARESLQMCVDYASSMTREAVERLEAFVYA